MMFRFAFINSLFRFLGIAALLAVATTPFLASMAAQAAAPLPTVTLTINGQKVIAEVASTPDQRATGLMNRFSLPVDHGMLFVFEKPEPLAFWMKNTYMPLSIAFIDAEGKIINIEHMSPQTETTHWSRGPGLYALEVRKGWFAERGIKAGDKVEGLDRIAR